MNGEKCGVGISSRIADGLIIDFQGIAKLIDTVSLHSETLKTLFRVLLSSHERLEARVVVELALWCRDPLAPLSSVCQDALQTSSDLERLLQADDWQEVKEVCPNARAVALLNMCEEILDATEGKVQKRLKRRACQRIMSRLKVAAVQEQKVGIDPRNSASHYPLVGRHEVSVGS